MDTVRFTRNGSVGRIELINPGRDRNWCRTFIAEANQAYDAIEALRIPTVAAVRGRAVGGHYELALRCDLIVAADDAQFTWVEADTGMAPLAGGAQRLAERVGRGRAAAQMILAQTIQRPDRGVATGRAVGEALGKPVGERVEVLVKGLPGSRARCARPRCR